VEGVTYDSSENKHKECLPETRTEVLRQVWAWAESSHGKCIYWLKGGAGTGKSTISRTIARQLNDKKFLGASFFFKRGEEGRNNLKWLFSTIAQQLATTIPELGPEIQKAVEEDPYISGKAPAEQFTKLMLQPLVNLDLDRTVTFVVVIDALDECQSDADKDDHDIKVLLRLLPRVQESKSVRLRFFLTSRPELPIRLGFKAVKNNLQNMDLLSIADIVKSGHNHLYSLY
jgi:Cdc6-like AAA superfamily ATPase